MTKSLNVLLGALLFALLSARAEADSFLSCEIASGSNGDIISVSGTEFKSDTFSQFYFGDGSAAWQPGERYSIAVSALAFFNNELYAFSPAGAAAYAAEAVDAKDEDGTPPLRGRWLRDIEWKHNWTAQAAGEAAGSLWAFGLHENSLVVAELQKNTVAAREDLSLESIEASGGSLLLVEHPHEDALELLWLAAASDRQTTVRHALFNGTEWQRLPAITVSGRYSTFAAARSEKLYLFFYKESGITSDDPLQMAAIDEAQQTGTELLTSLRPVRGISENVVFPMNFVAAGTSGEQPVLFTLNDGLVQHAKLNDAAAANTVTIAKLSWTKRDAGVYIVAAVLMAAYLVVFILSLRRSKKWPRKVQIDETVVTFASWKKRAAAFVTDALIATFVAATIAALAGSNWQQMVQRYYLFVLIAYYVILEAGGQTLGKRLFRIAVVTRDLKQPRFVHSLLRNIIRMIEHPILGVLVMLNLRTSQRVGDLLADTFVVNTPVALSDNEQE